ncbi:MAG: molybdenum cofactor guanylyltransferase [Salinigranum sp.]
MAAGLIVAGGRSTRFAGADKAVADLAGVPMIRRVADRLAPAVDALVVNCRAEQAPAIREALGGYDHPVRIAEDDDPDEGPVAGIRTGLRAVESTYAAVVSCDVPFVDPGFVGYLFERAAGHDAAVPRREDGWYQTMQAVYRTEPTAEACEAALARGDRRVLAPLEDLDYVVVGEAEVREHAASDTFDNLNTREEFEAAAERLRSDQPG